MNKSQQTVVFRATVFFFDFFLIDHGAFISFVRCYEEKGAL
jgi:hypothetical protein